MRSPLVVSLENIRYNLDRPDHVILLCEMAAERIEAQEKALDHLISPPVMDNGDGTTSPFKR